MGLMRWGVGMLLVVSGACHPAPVPGDQKVIAEAGVTATATPTASMGTASAGSGAAIGSGAPLGRLVPRPRSGPRLACPLAIVPGVSLGPVGLGETLEDLRRGGLGLENVTEGHADVLVPTDAGPPAKLGATVCAGKVIDVWLDDLRLAPPCVTLDGKAVAGTIAREELESRLGDCGPSAPRIGGAFERCAGGGAYVGHGLGTFLQLRVRPKDYPFDDACSYATEDGALVEATAAERTTLLKATLNLSELAPYWHPSHPGRDPLRLVRTSLVSEQPLTMFGSPVVWIDEKDAAKGSAYFKLTKLETTRTTAVVGFAYPVEGVSGVATFKRRDPSETWRLERATVSER